MDPVTFHYLAEARLAELRREADEYRLARQCPPQLTAASRVRGAVGRRIIRLGERLVPAPAEGSSRIEYQHP